MSFTKIATLLAVAAVSTQLVSAIGQYEIVEFNAILEDVKANLQQYMSLAYNDPNFSLPTGVLDVYQHMTTATDDSYTSYFTEMDFAQISTAMFRVPWYSSRLEPEIISALKNAGITITSLGQTVAESDAASTSASESSASSSAASSAASSSAASSSAASSAASSASSSKASSSAASSSAASSKASSSSAKATSSAEKSTNGSSSTTSKNAGAALDMGFFSAGVGAAIAGAAAMLL
ncbi:hypothetical protein SMKI_09G1540 [Saccharomyces mikatae IFO 1815]|uniref:Uncharacterized protein n=1 Tax=Saccharomyces mikatae IFO 1815 TaxID=226126 RepID=A0AA35IZG0_SACMI|nr:uncharacterized protein SMKI_09G1540 [Saccharomyces mikatae IFO 1815]CAI4039744.1 hypothetical protein SMKI_09G1540 [Saccharomyces mikatae IFO 1815]